MKIYKNKTVLDEGLDRIRRLFDDFENVVVGFSGGKDSCVVLNLALKVAEERNRLPLKVIFIDQEAEWQGTIDYVKTVMYDERVEPLWFQMPIVITNNASSYERYSICWNPEKKEDWLHPQDPISIKENKYGTERFHELFGAIFKEEFKGTRSCYLSGVRAEESPKRLMALTISLTYKDITWGKVLDKKEDHYTFYPIYDWNYTDVWKFIFDNKLEYCKIYDEMYRHGVKPRDMRISNLHHETAIQNLLLVQEIEPKTWERLAKRIAGANSVKHLKGGSYKRPKNLPYMFSSWKEYGTYLAEKLIQDEANKVKLKNVIEYGSKYLINPLAEADFYKVVVDTILCSDWDFTKLRDNFMTSPHFNTLKKYVDKKLTRKNIEINRKYDKYVKGLI